jgi:hypothetical protein
MSSNAPLDHLNGAGLLWRISGGRISSLAAIMHDVTRFHTCVERVSGSNPTRWIGVVPLAVQRV